MGEDSHDDMLDSILAGPASSPGLKKSAHRRLFREMIRGELEIGPLSAGRRRSLIRFAKRLGILADEARLIVRAVEYEAGHLTATAEELIAADLADSHRRIEHAETLMRIGLAVMLATLFWLLARWIFGMAGV